MYTGSKPFAMKKILSVFFVAILIEVTATYAQKDTTLYLAHQVTLKPLRSESGYTKVRIEETVSTTAPNTFWMKTAEIAALQHQINLRAMHVVIRARKLVQYYPAPPEKNK